MKPRDASYFQSDVCKPFFYQGGETGIVLIHGFTGSVAHMRPLGEALHALSYTVRGINLPGHATVEKDLRKFGWQDWLAAANEAVSEVRQHCRIVIVCGLSMGAVLGLILAQRQKVDACISISAPLPAHNPLLPLTRIFGYILPRVPWKQDDTRQRLLDQRYDKGYTGFPMRKGADLYTLIQMAQRDLGRVTCPLLVVQSLADQAVSQDSADQILSGASSTKKQKLILNDVPHVCTLSVKLPDITKAIDTFISSLQS